MYTFAKERKHNSKVNSYLNFVFHYETLKIIMEKKKFSTHTALAFVLPTAVQAQVQSIRKVYDKAYTRWPPHINFFFPFLII